MSTRKKKGSALQNNKNSLIIKFMIYTIWVVVKTFDNTFLGLHLETVSDSFCLCIYDPSDRPFPQSGNIYLTISAVSREAIVLQTT